MAKKILLIGVFIVIIAGGAIWFLKERESCGPSNVDTSGIILFYGNGCPHCAIVDEYIKTNNVKDRVLFEEKEVFYDKCNAKLLESSASKCGLSTENLGVPFLWDGANSTCLAGDQDIINFFKEKIGG
jgi:hypothetical protein